MQRGKKLRRFRRFTLPLPPDFFQPLPVGGDGKFRESAFEFRRIKLVVVVVPGQQLPYFTGALRKQRRRGEGQLAEYGVVCWLSEDLTGESDELLVRQPFVAAG